MDEDFPNCDMCIIEKLASLNIDAILQETTIYRRRRKLSVLTDDLLAARISPETTGATTLPREIQPQ